MLGMPGSAKVTRCSVSSTQVGSQPFNAFSNPLLSGRLALEFKGNIATEADFLEHAGDPGIIQIQRVPFASSKIGFGLHEDSSRGYLCQLGLGYFEEISGIHQGQQPWRIDGVQDAQ